MPSTPRVGDLVHIPQAVDLIHHVPSPQQSSRNYQLTIPLTVRRTEGPTVAIVTEVAYQYVKIFCEGETWSVKPENIYSLRGGNNP